MEGGVPEEKLHTIPEAVDIKYFNPNNVLPLTIQDVSDEDFVFVSVFKWEQRKGWEILLKAYLSAFQQHDQVALVILTNAFHSSDDFEEMINEFIINHIKKDATNIPKIRVLPTGLSQEELKQLYKAGNAFVIPSRGEGWGRPHVEAMSMALPILSTFWSGPTEYMTEENSYPLNIDGLVEITEGAYRGHKWAEPSVAHLSELMVHVFNNPEEAARKGQVARNDMKEKYSPQVIGKVLFEQLHRIQTTLSAKASSSQALSDTTTNIDHEEL